MWFVVRTVYGKEEICLWGVVEIHSAIRCLQQYMHMALNFIKIFLFLIFTPSLPLFLFFSLQKSGCRSISLLVLHPMYFFFLPLSLPFPLAGQQSWYFPKRPFFKVPLFFLYRFPPGPEERKGGRGRTRLRQEQNLFIDLRRSILKRDK